jgi:hypothetical protein
MTPAFVAGSAAMIEDVGTLLVLAGAIPTRSFRRWRLERYFANTPAERLTASDNGKG